MNLLVSADFCSSSFTKVSESVSRLFPTLRKTTWTVWIAARHTWDLRFLTDFSITFLRFFASDSSTFKIILKVRKIITSGRQ